MAQSRAAVRVEFGVLGPLRLTVAGEERAVAGEKLQALLARLLVEPNRPVPTDRLIDELWGDDPPATARQSLHVHVGRLRRLLAADGVEASSLAKVAAGYVLHVDADALDETRFRTLVDEAREERDEGRLETAAATFRRALALWRGEPLQGIDLPWAEAERARLEELRVAVVEERIDVDLQLGRAVTLVPELEALSAANPLRERLRAQLMLALYASGRQADALAAYRQARRDLDEVGLEPGPRLRELEQAILRQDPQLTTAPLPAASTSRRRPRRLVAAAMAVVAVAAIGAVMLALRDEPPRAAQPARVVVRPDSLVEIDPATNRVVASVQVGKTPDSIAATADAMWVANIADRTVSRVDLATRQVRVLGGAPVAYQLVSGLNGDVWLSSFEEPLVTLIARRGRIVQDVVSLVGAPVRVGLPGSAEGLAVGGGYLWVTSPSDSGGDDRVFRVDLRSRRVVSATPVGALPLFVAFGYGSAWVSNYRGASVSVVRPGSREAESVAVPEGPLGIAAGEGGVWVASFWTRTVSRIDPETRRVVERIPVGAGPLAVAAGAGAVWVTNRDDRTVSRIDPRTNRVSHTIPLAASPYGIRVAHGRVWVTTQKCGSPVKHC